MIGRARTAPPLMLAGVAFLVTPFAVQAWEEPTKDEHIRSAIARGATYLKGRQSDGNWDSPDVPFAKFIPGGMTCLVVHALLQAGTPADDPAITSALDYTRHLECRHTYVVALQTIILARVHDKGDRDLVKRNVAWLKDCMVWDKDRFIGWSYQKTTRQLADNSNTEYAIHALDAASALNLSLDAGRWKTIRDYYRRTQRPDGGWCYMELLRTDSTVSMTAAGACGLVVASRELREPAATPDKHLARAVEYLGDCVPVNEKHYTYQTLYKVARAGRLLGKRVFVGKRTRQLQDWYEDGCRFLLGQQEPDGSWKSPAATEKDPLVATSFALLFLAEGKGTAPAKKKP